MQGVFLVGVLIVFLLLFISAFPSLNNLKLLSALGAGFILSFVYRYLIAPALTFHFNHYWPDLSYLQLPMGEFTTHLFYYIFSGISLFIDTFRFLVGNISPLAAVLLILLSLLLFVFFAFIKAMTGDKNVKMFLIVAVGFIMSYILICMMLTLMVLRHELILLEDLRRVYYGLPLVSILCMTMVLVLSQLSKIRFMSKWPLFIFIVIMIAENIYAMPQHRAIMSKGYLKSSFKNVSQALATLNNYTRISSAKSPEY